MSETEKGTETTEAPKGLNPGEVCVHEVRPEIMKIEGAMDAMKMIVVGHLVGDPHANDEIFAMVTSVPNAAVFASRILEEVGKADQLTQMITTLALQREMAEQDERERAAKGDRPEPEQDEDMINALAALFGGSMGGMVVPLDKEQAFEGDEPIEGDGYDPYQEDVKPRGVKAVNPADEPVRRIYFATNPDDRATFAPVDNRDEYPNIGGYL